jgi:hypothetical protein
MIVTAMRPANSPVRMDSIGKPGTPHVPPDAGVIMPVVIVLTIVVVLLVMVDTMVVSDVEVVYDVVVPGTLSGP